MKPESKRKTTHQGLGGGGEAPHSADEARPASTRAAVVVDEEPVESSRKSRTPTLTGAASAPAQVSTAPQMSAPPPSRGGAHQHTPAPRSVGPVPRQTRDIEATPPAPPSRSKEPPPHASAGAEALRGRPPLDTKPPKSQPIERVERGAPVERVERVEGVERVERVERVDRPPSSRKPIDVTHVDAGRVRKLSSGKPAALDSASGGPTSQSPARVSPRPAAAPASSPTSERPVTAHGGQAVPRSKRVSIREEDVGTAVRRIGPPSGAPSPIVPRLLLSEAEIAAAPIDHRAGFLLAHIDGGTSVQGLVDIAGMGEDEVHEILDRLRRLGIVAIR